MKEGKAYLKPAMAFGNVAFRKEFSEVAATMKHLEMTLEEGAVVSRAVH